MTIEDTTHDLDRLGITVTNDVAVIENPSGLDVEVNLNSVDYLCAGNVVKALVLAAFEKGYNAGRRDLQTDIKVALNIELK